MKIIISMDADEFPTTGAPSCKRRCSKIDVPKKYSVTRSFAADVKKKFRGPWERAIFESKKLSRDELLLLGWKMEMEEKVWSGVAGRRISTIMPGRIEMCPNFHAPEILFSFIGIFYTGNEWKKKSELPASVVLIKYILRRPVREIATIFQSIIPESSIGPREKKNFICLVARHKFEKENSVGRFYE